MPELHQTPGCIMLPSRWYVFNAEHGCQIVDQPRRGFATERQANVWLAGLDLDLSLFVVALGKTVGKNAEQERA